MIARSLACLALVALAPSMARAQAFPDHPIHFVVPFGPGGSPDVLTRVVAAQMEQALHQPVIIDNRAGANGVVGANFVARAAPDGYTLLSSSASFSINPFIYKTLPYDPVKSFAPVADIGLGSGYILVVNAQSPIHSIADLIAAGRARRLTYSSPGIGNTNHLAAALLAAKTGMSVEHAPYKSAPEALTGLLSNEVQFCFATAAGAMPLIQSGALRAIGFSGDAPLPALPSVELVSHAAPDFHMSGGWQGVFAPAGTPPAIVDALNKAIVAAAATRDARKGLDAVGYAPDPSAPQAFADLLQSDAKAYAEAVRAAKIEPQ